MKTEANSSNDFNRVSNTRLNQVKKTVRRRLAQEFQDVLPLALIRRAVDEAEQLAHSTDFPQLVFPLLAEEQVRRISYFASHHEATHSTNALISAA